MSITTRPRETFSLSPEAALIFAAEGDPRCLQGFFQAVKSAYDDEEKSTEAIRTGKGLGWGDRSPCCFCGTDRFFRPGYAMNLVNGWIPALTGMEERLKAGARVVDIGCGHGSSTVLMAQAFPNSTFTGVDFHAPSVEAARAKAREAGVTNVELRGRRGEGLHRQGLRSRLHLRRDPRHGRSGRRRRPYPPGAEARRQLHDRRAARRRYADRQSPSARPDLLLRSRPAPACPASKAQEVGLALGAQAGEKRLAEVLREGGFASVRRAAQTDTNMVLEARSA